ncbi:MAG: hypothetical protein ACTHMS_16725 [Jatrophihabitans sp.]|uniref:hypothetical protein n=1 Tax=Jatrophihabitans sp. TaxID=1932789 RepID=UPI003F821DCB
MPTDDLLALDLSEVERAVLRAGLIEWGGPARITEEFAVALGFIDQADLFRQAERIIAALNADQPLSPLDWARTVLATEVVFVSNLVGSGREWSITTGLPDADTIRILREVQRKLPSEVRAVVGTSLGTKPDGQPG